MNGAPIVRLSVNGPPARAEPTLTDGDAVGEEGAPGYSDVKVLLLQPPQSFAILCDQGIAVLRPKLLTGVLVATLALVVILGLGLQGGKRELYREYESPSGAWRLVVYRQASRVAVMPGDASGASGFVELRNAQGRVCGRADLPLMAVASSASDAKWDEGEVSIPGAFDLPLACR